MRGGILTEVDERERERERVTHTHTHRGITWRTRPGVFVFVQITFSVDGEEDHKHLSYDFNLIHRDNYVFLGGSDDTMLLTQNFVYDNFHGIIRKVCGLSAP